MKQERDWGGSWTKTNFGHCPVEQPNVSAFISLGVDWDTATFPGHLLPTPTFEI